MTIDHHVMALIEERERINAQKRLDCYGCGISPEVSGGLCVDCLMTRAITA